jgi:MYXO-CTERM domain-containing protein
VLAQKPVAFGSNVVNIGRVLNGTVSMTDLYVSAATGVKDGAQVGYPLDYLATDYIEHGDSGGPDVVPGSSPHEIVAVNSGSSASVEILARVDLLCSWIQQQIQAHGGSCNNQSPPPDAGGGSGDSGGGGDDSGSGGGDDSGGGGEDAGSGDAATADSGPSNNGTDWKGNGASGGCGCGSAGDRASSDYALAFVVLAVAAAMARRRART